MKNELISVVIPTYNRGKVIRKSIESVLIQSYKNIELIIIDDGSTDNTEFVVKKISDNRIKYIKLNENKGACYARNIGIKKAKGKYIAFQDSDDIFDKYKLEKQLMNLKKMNSDLDFCKIKVHSDTEAIFPDFEIDKELDLNKITSKLCFGNLISTQSILIKTDIIKRCLFDAELPRLQDFDLALRISQKCKVSYTKEVLVDLYRYGDNISLNIDKLKKAILIISGKKYNLNKVDSYNLRETLMRYLIWEYNKEFYLKIKELEDQIEINRLNYEQKIFDYENKTEKLIDENNKILIQYNNVINSKGWIFLEKIRKIKNKIFKIK